MARPAPTVRSIAKALNLSRTTVSDALRGMGRVDRTTAQRILRYAERVVVCDSRRFDTLLAIPL